MSLDVGQWINTAKYTTPEIVFFSLGGFFWVVCYAAVLGAIRKHRVVEIPAAAVVANMAWETTWFQTTLLMCKTAASTDGPGGTWANIKIHVMTGSIQS